MPKESRSSSLKSRYSPPTIGADIISRILSILQSHTSGIGLSDLIKELKVSRLTLLKWLSQMEDERLLYRSHAIRGKRGRPEVHYHLSEDSIRILSNATGTFVLTGIGRHKGLNKYRILENSLDLSDISKSILELDERILAASFVSYAGALLSHTVKQGYEKRFDLDKSTLEKWSAWTVVMCSLAEQQGKLLSESEYVTIGQKDFNCLIIPFNKLDLLVRLMLQKTIEVSPLTEMISERLDRLTQSRFKGPSRADFLD